MMLQIKRNWQHKIELFGHQANFKTSIVIVLNSCFFIIVSDRGSVMFLYFCSSYESKLVLKICERVYFKWKMASAAIFHKGNQFFHNH